MELKNLVLKLTFDCICRCKQCNERMRFYEKQKTQQSNHFTIIDIKRLFKQAYSLGTESLQLSGGEVMLYPRLLEVVSEARKYGWFIFINSVGFHINKENANELLSSGLNAFNISLDSVNAAKHDSSRGVNGLFKKAINTLDAFHEIRERKRTKFFTNIQTIIMKNNYKELPDLFTLAMEHNVSSIYLMHIYDDYENEFCLDKNDIKILKNKVIPNTLKIIKKTGNNLVYNYAKSQLNNLFETKTNSISNYEKGVYWESKELIRKRCQVPYHKLMILPNGNAFPCCTLENRETVVIGNTFTQTLKEIWEGEKMKIFRKNRVSFCKKCPSIRNRTIGLIPEMLNQY